MTAAVCPRAKDAADVVGSGAPDDPDRPVDLRATDADREAALDQLREASVDGRLTIDELSQRAELVHEARTHGALLAVTADLGTPTTVRLAESAPDGAVNRPRERHRTVFALHRHRGRRRMHAATRFDITVGNVHLDLRDVLLDGPRVDVHVRAVLGWMQVIVPEGIDVRFEGDGLLTNREIHLRGTPVPPGAPVVVIHVRGFLGSVSVRSRPRRRPSMG